jgi:hypothetical protein
LRLQIAITLLQRNAIDLKTGRNIKEAEKILLKIR